MKFIIVLTFTEKKQKWLEEYKKSVKKNKLPCRIFKVFQKG